ncbi:bacteriocin biosynthesis docking scaffold, SagD family [Actinomyces bovis]|uniref:Bacteriocin biosynthesis docking scaffold, SagD family n=1 Tax=Actinomyces bovis TaxID=1658 RepID=A0ABY1VL13_9ACTO|nr:YcaO-like family protein [Actinomyces bovis]SPT52789.1 bacteriocin biosynthesis docking scaffold, SagD family [Actinomyces bovis]VEG54821.1 bacteriocin biosynthesis docking scaffold, SagD family [Actinomyces israelii]
MTVIAKQDVMARRQAMFRGPWVDREPSCRVLEELASPFLGIATDIVELTYDADDVRSFYVGAGASDTNETLGHPANSANGGGSFDRLQARASAIGETVERCSAAYLPTERLVEATFEQLTMPAVDPTDMALFSAEQYVDSAFQFTPFARNTRTRWVDGVDLIRATPALVPAQVVFLNSRRSHGEPALTYSTSNGLACGPNRREAIVSSLLELVERDALMVTWHAGLSMPLIDISADPELDRLCRRHFTPTGISYAAVDLTEHLGVPTALGIVRNLYSDWGALALGAAARPTLAEAAIEALLEAFQTRTWCKAQQRTSERITDDVPYGTAINGFDDHVRYYGERDRAALASFLWASEDWVDPRTAPVLPASTPAELIEAVLGRLEAQGVDVYAVDVTSPDIVEAGLSVVKTYSPQLQPLDAGWNRRFLGGRRIYERPLELGYTDRVLGPDDLTPFPHPFP